MTGSSIATLNLDHSYGDGTTRVEGKATVMVDGQSWRTILPIPDVPHVGLTTYDAKDPDTSYPPIRDVRPPDYTAHTSRFNGKIHWVRIDLGEDAKDADHYIDADERLRVAMARQ